MSGSIRFDLVVAELTSFLTADHDLGDALQRIVDRAVSGMSVSTGSLLITAGAESDLMLAADGSDSATLELHRHSWIGPAADSVGSGSVVLSDDLQNDSRWPALVPFCRDAAIRGARAYPVRLANRPIGALTLYSDAVWSAERPSFLGQTLADLAGVAIGLEPVRDRQESAANRIKQLIAARVRIDQATGMVAQYLNVDLAQARDHLRRVAGLDGVLMDQLALDLINDRETLARFSTR